MVRVTDVRKATYTPLCTHRVRTCVFSLCIDAEAIYAGCDHGVLRT